MYRRCLFAFAAAVWFPAAAAAQLAISPRAGLVHYSDGRVLVDGAVLSSEKHRFQQLREGQLLRTEQGRAEVLLGPGCILRVGPESQVRLLSDDIIAARVELLAGSALIDWRQRPTEDESLFVVAGAAVIEINRRGLYRIDVDPDGTARLRVFSGAAFVGEDGSRVSVGSRRQWARGFEKPRKFDLSSTDALDEWNQDRAKVIERINRATPGRNRELVRGLRTLAAKLGRGRTPPRRRIGGGRFSPRAPRR